MLRTPYRYMFVFLLIFVAFPIDQIVAQTQTRWFLPTTVGYAGVGTGLGVLAAWDSEPAEGGPIILAGLVLGGISGYIIGHNADRALARGDTLTVVHRYAVRLGTILTGSTLGALTAAVIISPKGPSSLGNDESIFTACVLAGSVLGTIVQIVLDSKLYPADRLHIGFGISPKGRAALGFSYHF